MGAWIPASRSDGPKWAFPLVLLVATITRGIDLGRRSLWTDEASTWTAASLPFAELIQRCIHRDASPPLHYLLTKAAISRGDGETMLRLVPMLASLGLVWLTYRLARLGLPRGSSAFAALLVAISPFQIMYAQEARTYMTVALFGVWATYLFARGIASDRNRAWPAYAAAMALGLWTQSLALLAVPAHGLIAISSARHRRRLWPWVLALVAAVLLYLPWAWASREVSAQLASSHWYIDEPDALGVFKVLRAVLVTPLSIVTPLPGSPLPGLDQWMPRPIAWGLVALPAMLLLLFTLPLMLRQGGRGHLSRVAWAAWVVPIVLVFAVSFQKPLFLPRYFVFATPYIAVLLALSLAELRGVKPLRLALGGLVLATSLLGLARYRADYTKEPWREAVAHVESLALPQQSLALVAYDADPFAYYVRHDPHPVEIHEVGHPDQPFAAAFTPAELDELEAEARKVSAHYTEVWVLVRSANSEVRREVARRAEYVASEGRTLVETRRWDSASGSVRGQRYLRLDPADPDSSTSR